MNTTIETVTICVAAISCGLMAGVYLAFSTFVMKALDRVPHDQAITAMQSINREILASAFMPLFFVTTAISIVLAAYGAMIWGEPSAWALTVGGTTYVSGMFFVTAFGNVPLNKALDRVDEDKDQPLVAWRRYLRRWTRLNHVRTLASCVACGLFSFALM